MKIFYFDLETTGVNPGRNGIHQISGMVEIDGEIKEEFDFKVKPNPLCIIDDKALEVAGVTKEQIMAYEPMDVVHKKLIDMLGKYVDKFDKTDKFFLAGYNNASFDNQFLRGFFLQNDDAFFGSWFWSNSIDVMVLATQYLLSKRSQMTRFTLSEVASFLGIRVEKDDLHNALYDVKLTRDIYKIITGNNDK